MFSNLGVKHYSRHRCYHSKNVDIICCTSFLPISPLTCAYFALCKLKGTLVFQGHGVSIVDYTRKMNCWNLLISNLLKPSDQMCFMKCTFCSGSSQALFEMRSIIPGSRLQSHLCNAGWLDKSRLHVTQLYVHKALPGVCLRVQYLCESAVGVCVYNAAAHATSASQ